jgi:hypothetical protein
VEVSDNDAVREAKNANSEASDEESESDALWTRPMT